MRYVFAVLMIATVGAGPEVKTFTDVQGRFAVDCPATWAVADKLPEGRAFSATFTTGGTTRPAAAAVVAVTIQEDPKSGSDGQTLRDVANALVTHVFNRGIKVFVEPDTVAGLPARRVRFVNPSDAGPTAAVYVIVVKQKRAFVLTLVAPPEDGSAATAEFDSMVKAFKPG